MNLLKLLGKIEKLNKLNNELGIDTQYYLPLYSRYDRPIYLYKVKDISRIKDKYINELSEVLIHNEIIKSDAYVYDIDTNCEKFYLHLGEI